MNCRKILAMTKRWSALSDSLSCKAFMVLFTVVLRTVGKKRVVDSWLQEHPCHLDFIKPGSISCEIIIKIQTFFQV